MTTESLIGRAASLAASLLDKATETKFFLQILCLFLYFEIGTSVVLGQPFLELTWVTLQHLAIGKILIGILLYFGSMSYILVIPYGMLLYIGRMILPIRFFTNYERAERKHCGSGMVFYRKALEKAYEAKDKELKKEVDEHRAACVEKNAENYKMGFLAFSAIIFGCIDFFLIRNSFLAEGYNVLTLVMPENIATMLVLLLLLPLLMQIHTNMESTFDTDYYLYHPALHRELEAEKKQGEVTKLKRVS